MAESFGRPLMQLVVHPETVEVVWDEGMRQELLRNGDMAKVLEVLAAEIAHQAIAAKTLAADGMAN